MRLIRPAGAATLAIALACSDPADPESQLLNELPRPLSLAEQKVAAASNQFAFDLFREVNSRQLTSNVFISPLSASMALGMTLNGASGGTWDDMRAALRLTGASQQEVNEGYRDLVALLRGLDPSAELRIANSVWYDQDFSFHAAFLEESSQYFDAEVRGLNFVDQPAALAAINAWVSTATDQRIPTILESIAPDEIMFLINAIYFKGAWQKQFERQRTANAPFYALDGTSASVPLMHQPGSQRLATTGEYTALDLSYGNSAFSMTILLPHSGYDVNTIAESLEQSGWETLVNSFAERETDLYLPRFTLTWDRELTEVLKAMGMESAFTPRVARFDRMSPLGDELFISRVKQKTFLEVNEEGTEAAAATAVGIAVTSAPPSIRVDRPFILVIRERFSGTILFIGKIAKLPA